MNDFNAQIIEEFHINRGTVTTMGFGDRLVLLHSVGARSGAPRVNPLMAIPDGDGWLVAASKGGAPESPDWYHNLLANPAASVEVPDASADSGIAAYDVVAEDLQGTARDEAWAKFTAAAPGFAAYETNAAPRVIPVVRLARR
ncbi:nitroreductase/quinone reductase family protein [Nocardioides sp.]|uniref:nitroreductase/quinone reductase family protein n=1 Tax=Nocardioides sp. TaxID=35761 RepID=UPI00286DA8D0|nr:nitroreductase/quinone reductase family protein [Nocardioides sp.]